MSQPFRKAKLLTITGHKQERDAVFQQTICNRKAVGVLEAEVEDRYAGGAGPYFFEGVRYARGDHDIIDPGPRQ